MAKVCKRLKKSALPEKLCSLDEALAAAAGGSGVKFDESVDIAVLLGVDTKKSDQAVRGAVTLPAGSGKTVRVGVVASGAAAEAAAAAGADKTGFEDFIEEIKKGELDFDVLIATPDVMHKLAAAGKILGPRGLMPNPKTGTVAADAAAAVKNAKTGQARFRADKAGIVHASVGKASFSPEALKKNVESLIGALKRAKPASSKGVYLRKMSVSCTMGRSVSVDISSYR
ncbi:MAG: 50S ribosomal protein L1 [Betaproteobacteria bacterium]|nr:50S ribosomal protein L1 [Betaproteobacteria bacterium]